MKQFIKKMFQPAFTNLNESRPGIAIDMATAILMIEVSRADFQQDVREMESIRLLLLSHLALSEEEVDRLLEAAHGEADRLVSLQHITRMMNKQMGQKEKVRVIELMWEVAFADGEKHHYEEHLLRQVADLLYVSHADFIQARHRAEESG